MSCGEAGTLGIWAPRNQPSWATRLPARTWGGAHKSPLCTLGLESGSRQIHRLFVSLGLGEICRNSSNHLGKPLKMNIPNKDYLIEYENKRKKCNENINVEIKIRRLGKQLQAIPSGLTPTHLPRP